MEINSVIKNFIQGKIGQEINFVNDDNIFELGLVNSLFAMQLVMFLEKEFDIEIENEDLNLKTFSTVNNMKAFIESKLN